MTTPTQLTAERLAEIEARLGPGTAIPVDRIPPFPETQKWIDSVRLAVRELLSHAEAQRVEIEHCKLNHVTLTDAQAASAAAANAAERRFQIAHDKATALESQLAHWQAIAQSADDWPTRLEHFWAVATEGRDGLKHENRRLGVQLKDADARADRAEAERDVLREALENAIRVCEANTSPPLSRHSASPGTMWKSIVDALTNTAQAAAERDARLVATKDAEIAALKATVGMLEELVQSVSLAYGGDFTDFTRTRIAEVLAGVDASSTYYESRGYLYCRDCQVIRGGTHAAGCKVSKAPAA